VLVFLLEGFSDLTLFASLRVLRGIFELKTEKVHKAGKSCVIKLKCKREEVT